MRRKLHLFLLAFAVIVTFLLESCKKEENYKSNATIIGMDQRVCVCCGGFEIVIDNIANPNGNAYFLVGQLPSGFNLGNSPKFPIPVKLDWKIDTARCFGNYIEIPRITRR